MITLVPNFPINFSVTSQLYKVIYMYKALAGSEYRLVLVPELQSQPNFCSRLIKSSKLELHEVDAVLAAFAFLRKICTGKVEVREHTFINFDLRGHITRLCFD